jgi:hypothetical protein
MAACGTDVPAGLADKVKSGCPDLLKPEPLAVIAKGFEVSQVNSVGANGCQVFVSTGRQVLTVGLVAYSSPEESARLTPMLCGSGQLDANTTEVHEAVSQCMNYIRSFDDMGATLQTVHHNELGLGHDYRRVRATVVIGHQDRGLPDGMTREQVDQTIRSYNAHLSRVQVLTWDDLLESAERALTFEL